MIVIINNNVKRIIFLINISGFLEEQVHNMKYIELLASFSDNFQNRLIIA